MLGVTSKRFSANGSEVRCLAFHVRPRHMRNTPEMPRFPESTLSRLGGMRIAPLLSPSP